MKIAILVLVAATFSSAFADSGIPEACQVRIEQVHINHFEGIVTKANLSYDPGACVGIEDRWGHNSCSILYRPESCFRGPDTHQVRNEEGKTVTLTGDDALCDYIAQENHLTKGMKYSCSFNRVTQIPQIWTPTCQGAEFITSGELVRDATAEEVKTLKCEALSECLQSNNLSFFERRSARRWQKNLNCE